MRLPTATNLHKGLDGLVIGAVLIFLAKLPILTLIGYRPNLVRNVNRLQSGIIDWANLGVIIQVLDKSSTGTDGVSITVDLIPLTIGWVLSIPFRLFGYPPFVLDAILVWVGGWIILLVPGYYWIGQPLVSRIRQTALGDRIIDGILRLVFRIR